MVSLKTLCFLLWCLVGFAGLALGQQNRDLLKEEWCGDVSCYDVLGVKATDDFRAIKKIYNNISLLLHPDKNPNATKEDIDKYVKVNKAYEVLSNSRDKYDEYLRLKSSMDSPRENVFFVLFLLYLAIVFVVFQYQKQRHGRMRKGILEIPQIQAWLHRHKHIEISQKKQKKVKRGRSKRALKNKKGGSQSDLRADDDEEGVSWMNTVTDDMINEALAKSNTIVPGWKEQAPSYQQAAWDVPLFCLSKFGDLIFTSRWHICYTLLKMECSETDREEMCRRAHSKTDEEWDGMTADEKGKFLQRPGPWKPEKADKAETNNKKKKKRS